MTKIIIFICTLIVMLLNIFLFELEKGNYYFLNSALMSLFLSFCYFWDNKHLDLTTANRKVLKVLTVISLLCLIGLTVITFLMPLYNSTYGLIGIFSFINTIVFIVYLFKYEFKINKGLN